MPLEAEGSAAERPLKKSHRAEIIMIAIAALVLIGGGLALLYFASHR